MSKNAELVFGLVGASGADLEAVSTVLQERLKAAGYAPQEIHLSALLSKSPHFIGRPSDANEPEDERIERLMNWGDKLRIEIADRGDAVVLLGINKIHVLRGENGPKSGTAYILRSLKHPDEIKTLREIYGEGFIVMSVYVPRSTRITSLSTRIARSRSEHSPSKFLAKATQLIDRDENDKNSKFGQQFSDAFQHGDIFISAVCKTDIEYQLRRFVDIIFGYPFANPTIDEYGMFLARASALRSTDLARQVGATIMTKSGEVLATGCNEVPRAGGGFCWPESASQSNNDDRDHIIGYDTTARKKTEIISEILDRMKTEFVLNDKDGNAVEVKSLEKVLKGSRVSSLLEFGRMVHAEMAAITEAARRGTKLEEATLYCTTFPCHMCARHIIASGIKRMVYVEPYPKSLAKELYEKAINVDHDENTDPKAVKFEPFMGVAPGRYLPLFAAPEKRKDDEGFAIKWRIEGQQPKIFPKFGYIDIEARFINDILPHTKG